LQEIERQSEKWLKEEFVFHNTDKAQGTCKKRAKKREREN
jgi:hypothetical protein